MKGYKKISAKNIDLTTGNLFKRCLVFAGASLLISAVVTIIISSIFYKLPDPTSKIHIASLLSMYISALISGFILSKINKQKYLASGFILGMILFLLNFILSLVFNKDLSVYSIVWKILIIVVCVLGSALGVKKERKSFRKNRFLR